MQSSILNWPPEDKPEFISLTTTDGRLVALRKTHIRKFTQRGYDDIVNVYFGEDGIVTVKDSYDSIWNEML